MPGFLTPADHHSDARRQLTEHETQMLDQARLVDCWPPMCRWLTPPTMIISVAARL